ncbi:MULTISPECIES: hypothetical protein [unclassified Aeromicrobium]|uniref:hypothetical protein n=1 Tax=unclassified Aeromicrobium TaxID=2633570 RepID=UPI00396B3995
MHEQFEVSGGPLDGQSVALENEHDEEVIFTEGKVKHVYRTSVRRPKDETKHPVLRKLLYVGPNPFSR